MSQYQNPKWWNLDIHCAWNHIKRAIKSDWEQAKQGYKPVTDQSFNRPARHVSGLELVPSLEKLSFKELEPACRFGFGARLKFGGEHAEWDENLEIRLAKDWRTLHPARKQTWEQDRSAILYGWNFEAADLLQL
jgi:hypothetical protein